MRKFTTTAPITVVLNFPAGRVQLIAADRTDATVEIRPSDPAKSRDTGAAEKATVGYTDGILRIDTAERRRGSLEITVRLPAGSRVEAKTAGAELRGVGRLGDVTFDGAYRHIKIDEAASLKLTAIDGDVEVGRLTGPATITTARGDIRIAEAVHGAVVLDTRQGDITITAAAGVFAALDAGTGHGRVSNALRNDGTPGLDIRATTGYGDIAARSL
jgi:hypothetical protein